MKTIFYIITSTVPPRRKFTLASARNAREGMGNQLPLVRVSQVQAISLENFCNKSASSLASLNSIHESTRYLHYNKVN